ncbi:IclR family transcriptional regulator [Notoacmeibacter sp. MSK16QG-6]|uniref:IclR family transcriptional regulator n=1 Tax=Notoacmeibacter sp. MSK16QG-6 TaxID=2957982 RepID=UPI0020A1DA44|nr:IclR family transcriptional regulator [Notoacmeibacter sp. MSK16QG-6]MCP1200443.1 IclR family transcriptional regulator [Notoacmeibacter sp. MSK16QG-6]
MNDKNQTVAGGTAGHAMMVGSPWSDGQEERGRTIQSVERALSLIEIMAAANEPLALNEIAARAQLNVSTCHHLIATLVGRGYVLHAGRNRGYMLSSRLNELVDMKSQEIDLSDFVRPKLTALSEQLTESVQLAVLRGTNLVTQMRIGQSQSVREADELKKMTALHATATGKAILAWLPEAEMVRVISENGMPAYTDRTITSLSGLMEELRHVRRNGFAIDDQEIEEGVVCCGSALRDEKGAVIASISVTFASRRNTEAYRTHVIRQVVQCARSLSDQLKVSRS